MIKNNFMVKLYDIAFIFKSRMLTRNTKLMNCLYIY